jgi:hypothetical protein
MEEKKFDLNSIIGFALIFGILMWIMYQNQPTEQEVAAEKAKKEVYNLLFGKTNGSQVQPTTKMTLYGSAEKCMCARLGTLHLLTLTQI